MRALLLLVALPACIDDLDPRWTLQHDHVVALRASPPAIEPGESAMLDALVAHADGPTTLEVPIEAAALQAPPSLEGAVYTDGGRWFVYGPSAETLAIARTELDLAADAPVPLDVYAAFARPTGDAMYVKKRVWLGTTADNPAPPLAAVDGTPMPEVVIDGPRAGLAPEIAIPRATDVYVSTMLDATLRANWLTSCGELFQDDVATAFVRLDEPCTGELALVVRAPDGGVAWRVWPLRSD